jgi:hypothetical protein
MPPEYQVTSVVVCRNAVVIGGGVYGDGEAARGFVRVLSSDKGETKAEYHSGAPLAYNGVVVAGGRIYATFADGTAACLGSK